MPYLLGASSPTTTHTTPSSASALPASIFLMRACGSGECRILPMSMPGRLRSSVYLPAPVVLAAESISATGLPMMENWLMSWHPHLRHHCFDGRSGLFHVGQEKCGATNRRF